MYKQRPWYLQVVLWEKQWYPVCAARPGIVKDTLLFNPTLAFQEHKSYNHCL